MAINFWTKIAINWLYVMRTDERYSRNNIEINPGVLDGWVRILASAINFGIGY